MHVLPPAEPQLKTNMIKHVYAPDTTNNFMIVLRDIWLVRHMTSYSIGLEQAIFPIVRINLN